MKKPCLHNSFLFLAVILSLGAWLIFMGSCANQGIGPQGGPRDSIPPIIVSSTPTFYQTNFKGNEIVISFNEYITLDKLNEKIVFSPPLDKKPVIRTQGKSVVIKPENPFTADRTYSVDLKDGIKDYTEGNIHKDLRLVFSTSETIDTLQVGGYILNAFTLEPVENCWAVIYSSDDDSLFMKKVPDFVAKTDKEGFFLFNNLPSGNFKLYGLTDNDNTLTFSQKSEPIAFIDSMISPKAEFVLHPDTIINENDTFVSVGHTEFSPLDLNLLLFTEDEYDQYISSNKRTSKDKCVVSFSEKLTRAVQVQLLNISRENDYKYIETNSGKDTVNIWITDSLFALKDTILMKIVYPIADSTGEIIPKNDTLKMIWREDKKVKEKAKEVKSMDGYFSFSTNLTSTNFELNNNIILEAPSPIDSLRKELIIFEEIVNDSVSRPVNFNLVRSQGSLRKYSILYTPSDEAKYVISMDTSVVKTLTGLSNIGFKTKFSTRKADYYGSFTIDIQGFTGEGELQLLKSGKKEDLITSVQLDSLKRSINFNFLKPDKYIVKLIEDKNNNKQWDPGRFTENRQPEPVYYFPKLLKVKSNWEFKENWIIEQGKSIKKSILEGEGDKPKP